MQIITRIAIRRLSVQVVDKGEDYKVKVKKWLMTMMTSDGDTRMKGENKKVIAFYLACDVDR